MDLNGTWETEAADALRHLALDEGAKAYVIQNPVLYRLLYRAALRFIGGGTLDECVGVARSLNAQGHALTIDFMGEITREAGRAVEATAEFLRVVRGIDANALDASVSLDLSHLGLVVGEDLCLRNASWIAEAACRADLEVVISAEGVDCTDAATASSVLAAMALAC